MALKERIIDENTNNSTTVKAGSIEKLFANGGFPKREEGAFMMSL
jgi:hypothetical protein